MKKPQYLFWLVFFIPTLFFPLFAEEFKRGDWMVSVCGGPESAQYPYSIKRFQTDGKSYNEHLINNFKYFSKGLHIEYAIRRDFSLALGYVEAESTNLVATTYGPPNEKGWYQWFEDTRHMNLKEFGLNGAYHLTFLRIRRLDPMLKAGFKTGRLNLVMPVTIIDFPPETITPGDWINYIERLNAHFTYFSTWLAVGCRYWLFNKLAIGCHYQIDFLLSQKDTSSSDYYTSITMDKKSRSGIFFEIVAKL